MPNSKERQEFKKLRDDWKEILSDTEKHPHCNIVNQLLYLTGRYRYWQVLVNEARIFRFDKNKTQILECSPFLDHFIDIGLIYSQAVGITALAFNTEEHDASLRNILNDMKMNHDKITRENFVLYDSEEEYKNNYDKEITEWEISQPTRETAYFRGAFEPAETFQRRHSFFDTLSGVSEKNRKKSDRISNEYFIVLKAKLDSCQKEKDYLNMLSHKKIYIGTKPVKTPSVTYNDLEECHKALWYVFHSIFVYFTDGSYGTISAYQGDLFEGLTNSWVSEENLETLRDKEQKFAVANAEDFEHYYGHNNDQ